MLHYYIQKIKPVILILFVFVISCSPEEAPESTAVFSKIQTLPEILSENSGMTEYESLIWFINDSGNQPSLYGYNKGSNEIVKTIEVSGADNTDWEDITQNSSSIFIGDFGNNDGSRSDLRIYIIDKMDMAGGSASVIPGGIIYFNYEDQTDFTSSNENTSFDCEAFIATEDSIFLFTKDWVSKKTSIYSIPVEPGTYSADFKVQLNVNGLITSAFLDADYDLLLLGYTPFIPFLWTLEGFDTDNFTYTNCERKDFIDYYGTQTEGLLVSNDGSVYISSEAITDFTINKPPQLFRLVDD